MAWKWLGTGEGPSRERLARVAATLFLVRVAEGLVAWLVFAAFFLRGQRGGWFVAAAFALYFLANLVVALRYRSGGFSNRWSTADVSANLLLPLPFLAGSGGISSPLLLLFPVKVLEYVVVFGERIAACYVFGAVAVVGALASDTLMMFLAEVAPSALPGAALRSAFTASLVAVLFGSPLVVVILRRAVADPEPPPRPTPTRRTEEGVPVAVANALLVVSEAVSRLTRLDEILETVVEVAPRSLSVDYCGIALWAEDTRTYVGAVAAGAGPTIDRRFAGVRVSPDDAPDFEWVRRLGHCAVVPASEIPGASAAEVPDMLIAPLMSGQRFYGVIQFARRGSGQSFDQRDLTIADGVARQTAVALERARLVEESRRLVRALESTGEAVLITDARSRVIFVNPAFHRTFGYREDEVLGFDASLLAGDGADWVDELGPRAQPAGWRGESVAYARDGRRIPVLADISLIRSEDGDVQGGVAIIEDISAQKTLQEQMQRADRLAAAGEMAAGLAHEINNALAAIFGQTARAAELGETDLRDSLARVNGQAWRIAEIVQGLLRFARPRPPQPVPVDLVAVTDSTLDLIRHDAEAGGVDVRVVHSGQPPLAMADPQQVQQVLLNLFGNALHAMAEGTSVRSLRVGVVELEERVAVRVSDSGPGIPEDIRPRIFDPFFSTKPDGSGLGLSVSYAIARAHGGDLQVTSEVGEGTTFTFLLPRATVTEETALSRVLLVDDDPEVAEALADMLESEGLQVDRAGTGREALEKLSAEVWDAVFLDVRLPDLSGREVFARLAKAQPELARRVVFVTGGLWRQESRLRQELSGQRVLAKPCNQEQVRAVLRGLRGEAV